MWANGQRTYVSLELRRPDTKWTPRMHIAEFVNSKSFQATEAISQAQNVVSVCCPFHALHKTQHYASKSSQAIEARTFIAQILAALRFRENPLWPLKFLQTSWDHDRPDTKWTLTSKPPAWKLSRGEAQFNPRSDRKSRARLGCTWSAIRNTAGETSPTQSGMFPTVPRTTSSVSAFLEAVRISSNWLSFI